MPSPQIDEFLGERDARRPREIERDQAGNIGDRKPLADDEGAVRSARDPMGHSGERFGLARLRELSDLRLLHFGHMRVRVAKRVGDMQHEPEFEPPLPHLDLRALERADAEQGRIGLVSSK